MTLPFIPVRPLIAALLAATLLPAGAVHAEERPAVLRETKVPALTAARSPGAQSADSMDRLREKLAERLGAAPAPASRSPYVVRVLNKAPGAATAKATTPREAPGHAAAAAVAGTGPAAQPAAAAGQISAALLAAPHRAGKAAAAPLPHGAAAAGHAHWSYQGDAGPQAWGSMQAEFGQCSTGQRQSPIDIRGGIQVELEPIQFDYRASGFSVIDNGHTVQVNLQPGNAVTVLGRRYELLQFHFHRPSEERINGRQFDMVAHLVHKDPDGKLAVVAVLLERGSGQPLVQAVWNALPLEKGEEQPAPGAIDLKQLLPQDRRYYTYMGSLTTPPCSEGVLWMVMKQPVQLSSEQIGIFARLYPMNARPIQQVAGRLIKESQ
ncbi:MAG TPA: carbonic anhydrase family protein [Ideonella sp.]|nr:carbonic anhydrase family protein [Ideonella sp.]